MQILVYLSLNSRRKNRFGDVESGEMQRIYIKYNTLFLKTENHKLTRVAILFKIFKAMLVEKFGSIRKKISSYCA